MSIHMGMFVRRSQGYGVDMPQPWLTRALVHESDVLTLLNDNGGFSGITRKLHHMALHRGEAVSGEDLGEAHDYLGKMRSHVSG